MAILLIVSTTVTALAVLVLLIAVRFKRAPTQATMMPEGYQEATITIDGGYHPDRIRVAKGVPVRLNFVRMEDESCSERVIFSWPEIVVDSRPGEGTRFTVRLPEYVADLSP